MTLKTDDPEDIDAGHKYAPDEEEILNRGVTYIHIGNEDIHSDRSIMNKPHETHYFDWLVSRGKISRKKLYPMCVGKLMFIPNKIHPKLNLYIHHRENGLLDI